MEKTTVEEAVSQLNAACADMAWWYSRSPQAIDHLTLDDFAAFQKEATRQMKAGFRQGI
ncbi:GpE family phage tail protein [Neisseria leonii]|uniref:GpE family phage tail protein n=1 Tax=Neisseria leonii TaxID=2995413 RepID=UPI00237A9EE4|nr:GpE family phage tail protein [Neisseria sp. 3986]MDD9325159.1 GpE family phage tail protein [Neisseria sp. 3986]